MKKVFIMNHGLASGGTDSFVINVAKGLDKNTWDVAVVLAVDDTGHKQFREEEITRLGIPVYRTCDLDNVRKVFQHGWKLYRLLKKYKVDVFHSNMDLMNGVNCFIAWLAGVKIRVCHSHNSSSQYEEKTGKHFVVGIYRLFMRALICLFSNRKCGCSSSAMSYLYGTNWERKGSTTIINNGIDTQKFAPRKQNAQRNPSCYNIVSVGRLANQKNPFFAVDVIESLLQLRQDFIYYWIGCGELQNSVKIIIHEKNLEGFVQMLGARKDLNIILPQCDALLMTSYFEGLPIALVEAQASGLPCVVSDTITREVDCGGCIFMSLDEPANKWATILSNLLDGTITFSIDQDRIKKFDVKYMIGQIEKVYTA